MLVCGDDAGVDEGATGEQGAGLLGGAFEGELREERGGGVVGQGDEEDFGGGAVDGADDKFADSGLVLGGVKSIGGNKAGSDGLQWAGKCAYSTACILYANGILTMFGDQLPGDGSDQLVGRVVSQARTETEALLGMGGNERRVDAVAGEDEDRIRGHGGLLWWVVV